MYTVYLDNNLIYDLNKGDDLVLIDPQLDLELNSPGTFTCTMPLNHPFYDEPKAMLSRVQVVSDGEEIFTGRIIDISVDFYKQKTLTCEGELGFLNDSIQRPAEYHDMTVRGYLQALVAAHNDQVETDKQFTVGIVTVTDSNDSLYRYTNNNTTMTEIKEDLIDDLGGYIKVRYHGGVRYLDYVNIIDYGDTNDNAIRFGENLLDFTEDMDRTDIATVIIPLGARLEESPIEALDMRLTIESVNSGKDWIQSDEAVALYGKITKTVTWDDVTEASNLLSKGKKWLSDTQWDEVELTVTAVDMHLTDSELTAFHLGDQLRVVSAPHGLDRYFPLSKMTMHLDHPENNEYTLGLVTQLSLIGQLITQSDVSKQLGSVSARVSSLTGEVDQKTSQVLQEAKDNATILINSATADLEGQIASATACGHVVIESPYEEILIMDTEDISTAAQVWRWNLMGLGYSENGYAGPFKEAITMNGAIVADFITTGELNADILTAGTIKDKKGYNSWDLDEGTLTTSNIIATGGTFSGSLNAASGTFTGDVTTIDGEYKSIVNGGDFEIQYNDVEIGRMYAAYWKTSTSTRGINLSVSNSGKFFAISKSSKDVKEYVYAASGSYSAEQNSYYLLNCGLNPNGDTERHHFYDDVNFHGQIHGWINISKSSSMCAIIANLSSSNDNGYAVLEQGSGYKNIYLGNRSFLGLYLYGTKIRSNVSISVSSDQRLKTEIADLTHEHNEFFDNLRPRTFRWKASPEETHIGFIAQEVNAALEAADLDIEDYGITSVGDEDDEEGYLSVAYEEIIPLLVKEVQELKAEVKDLKSRLNRIL